MKKTFIIPAAIAAAISFTSCENLPEQTLAIKNTPLSIKVGVQTKGLITETTLPDASEIGTFFYDESNATYDNLNFKNVKFTASGTGQSQSWAAERYIGASATPGHLYAYYPYTADATTETAISVSATPSHQVDYMWASQVENIDNKNSSISLVMNHALAAIRLNIEKGGYLDAGVLSQISLSGTNIAKSATLDITTGTLSAHTDAGALLLNTFDPVTLSDTPVSFEYIVVPVAETEATISIALVVDGKEYTVDAPAVELQQNTIHEYTLSMNGDFIVSKVSISPWNTINNNILSVETTKPVTVKIKHVDGTLWSAEAWKAGLDEGTVTNADATGVAIPDPNDPYSYLCVVHPTAEQKYDTWSSTTNVNVDGVFSTTDKDIAATDYAGQANTNAILAAVTAGTIKDAPAAQYCAGITFADGKTGYLPAAGEVQQMINCATDINACLDACGGTEFYSGNTNYWSSTQYSISDAWIWSVESNNHCLDNNDKLDDNPMKYTNVRVVSAF